MKCNKTLSAKLSNKLLLVVLIVCMVGILPQVSAFDLGDNLVSYYTLDETSGIVIDQLGINDGTNNGSTPGVEGIIETAYSFDGTNDYIDLNNDIIPASNNFSISVWANSSSTGIQTILSQYAGEPGRMGINFYHPVASGVMFSISGAKILDGSNLSDGEFHMITITRNNNNFTLYEDGSPIDTADSSDSIYTGRNTWIGALASGSEIMNGSIDELGIWNKSLNSTEIEELYNGGDGALIFNRKGITIDLDFPPEGVLISDVGLNFTANYTPIGYNLTNATYYIWKKDGSTYDEFNVSTTTDFVDNVTTQFIDSFTLGKYKWNVLSCGNNLTGALCVWAPLNYTFEVGASIDGESYSNSTFETTSEAFDINISLLSGVILYEAILNYNGTEYIGTITDLGGESYSISRTIDIPTVGADSIATFYWTFKYDDGGTTAQNSTIHNQTILDLPTITITDGVCNAGFFSSVFYNFSNSENLSAINVSIAYNFKFGIGDLNEYVVNGILTNKASFRICINSSIDEYKLGYGEIEYGSTDYIDRRYYMYEEQSLSNSTQSNHTLYLLPTVDSTSFIFEFKNTFLNPYTDKLVTLLRWYPEEDEYRVVEMAKTDDAGKTVMKVHTEDVDYRVGLYYLNGSLIKLADPVRMACLVDPCTYTLKVIHDPVDFDEIYNIESSLIWDEDNNRFVYVFNDPSQLTSQMRLHVYRDAGFQEILICNDTATGFTGVLTCDIGNYTGTLIAKVYRSASPEWPIASLYHSIRDGIESSFGLFASFLIVLTSALIGIFSPIGSIMLLLLGLIPAVFFGSITFAVFMGIGVLGGIIINVIKNYS